MFRLLTALSATFLLVTAPLSAAPRPDDKPGGPALIGQAKSLTDLLEMTKATVKNVGGEAMYKEFEKHMLPDLDPKKVPGIDPKRPFGIYVITTPKLEDCRGVVLIPVVSEKDFTDMLEAQRIPFTKGKEAGSYDFTVPPELPFPVSFKIHKEYAYIAIGGHDVLDKKVILDPADVINPKEKGVGYFSLRLDRVPSDLKKAMMGLVREQVENLKEMIREPELKDAFHAMEKLALRWLKTIFDEGKEITLQFDADTKTGELVADLTVEGMPKSPLAELFAKRTPTKNAFASLGGDDYAQRVFIKAPLFAEEIKEASHKLIDWAFSQMSKEFARGNAPPEAIQLVEAGFKSLKATIDSGEMDLAAAIRGPNKEGFYTAVGAVHCKEGAQLEKAIRNAVKVLPAREAAYFKFEAGKIGDVVVHEIDMSSEAEDVAKKVFGKGQTAYFAFAKDALYASYGPDGMKLLKEAIDAKPGVAPVLDGSSDPKKVADLWKRVLPQNDGNRAPASFAGLLGSATSSARVTIEGGDKLKIRASLNVGTIMMMGFGMYASEAGAPGAAPAPPPPPPPPPPAKAKKEGK
jgi:hypothetical protein